MAKVLVTESYLENIAEAIRTKNGEQTEYKPSEMASAIIAIPSSGAQVMSASDWNALTPTQKAEYGYVVVQTESVGFLRGYYIYGADGEYIDWAHIKGITISGKVRGSIMHTTQLGDMRFSDGTNYLPSQIDNIATSTCTYGNFTSGTNEGNTRYIFDNSTSTKTCSLQNSNGQFEWITTFTNAIDLSSYTTLELWTANDSPERDPYTNVEITFYDTNDVSATLTIDCTEMTTTRLALGYSNANYQVEAEATRIQGGIELLTRTEWNALTTEQKRAKQLVAIEDTNTGYKRGELVYGEDYSIYSIYQNNVLTGTYTITENGSTITVEFNGVGNYNGLILAINVPATSVSFDVTSNDTTIECGVCNNNGALPAIIQNGTNRVWYHDYMNSATGQYSYSSFNPDTMRIYMTSYTTSNVSFTVEVTLSS